MRWKALVSLGVLFCGFGFSQPVVKNGNCTQLTRYDAPGTEDWEQFPVEPQPQDSFPTGTIQEPLSPQQSINCAEVPNDLQAQIIASELTPGDAEDPMAYLMYLDFDSQGRVWALDVRDYPGPINSNRATGGDSRILIFEDTDSDGAMDNFKVFYDGLVIPTSLVVMPEGVVVTVAPYIYFIPNNNDQGGSPQTLFSGMGASGSFDTHGQINSLFYGLDNWIYGHTGYNGCSASSGEDVRQVSCDRGRTWRFRHTAIGHNETSFQTWTTGPSNAHGVGQTEDGQIFQSGATGTPHNNHSIRRGVASINITDRNSYYPITGDRFMWEGSTNGWPNNYSTFSSAASGHDFYHARLLPQQYWNKRGFVCEGASNLCVQDDFEVDGSTWDVTSLPRGESNVIASTDAWFAPLKVRTGPDGGLWVVDWYNYLFLHNPATPQIPGTGAWQNHLRTKERSRIYRLLPSDGSSDPFPPMTTEENLVNALGHSNMVWRLLAQRELIYRGMTPTLGDALENILTNSQWVDSIGNDPAVTHGVWVLEGLGELEDNASRWNPILENFVLKHPAWMTRRNVLMAMPRTQVGAESIEAGCATNDDHPHVRLQAMVALAESPGPNGPALWTQFDDVDDHINSARDAANVGTSPSRPCQPEYLPQDSLPIAVVEKHAGYNLRFNAIQNGFQLLADRNLISGELKVYDLRGRPVFQSKYDALSGQWTKTEAGDLGNAMYVYRFRDVEGRVLKGHVAPQLDY